MFENKVSVGPPMPSAQTVSNSRSSKERRSDDRFDQVLKSKTVEHESERPKESQNQSKRETVDDRAERSEKKQRDPTEKNAVGSKTLKAKNKKAGKGIAEQEISKFMDSLESEIGINPARLAEVLQEKNFQKLITSENRPTDSESGSAELSQKDMLNSLSDSLDLDKQSAIKLQELVQVLENRLKSIPKGVDSNLETQLQSSLTQGKTLTPFILKGMEQEIQSRSEKIGDSGGNAAIQAGVVGTSVDLQKELQSESLLQAENSSNAVGSLSPKNLLSSPLHQPEVGSGALSEKLNGLSKNELRERIIDMNERFWMKPSSMESTEGVNGSSLLPSGFEDKVRAMMADNAGVANASIADNNSALWNSASSPRDLTSPLAVGQNALGFSSDEESGSQFDSEGTAKDSASMDGQNLNSNVDFLSPSLSRLASTSGAGAGLGASALAGMSTQQRQENIQQLMNGAQILVKDGGGEMKVQMSPEGLGPVELKVTMQNGRLNVEMLTESKEAKKLIESQMTDLKMGLAAQKLAVDSMKVDVVTRLNTDSNAQNFANLNHHQQQHQQQQNQEQLRQMWGQFNDQFGSQGRRSSYFDMKGPKDAIESKNPLNPISANESPRRVVGKGDGLNLVA